MGSESAPPKVSFRRTGGLFAGGVVTVSVSADDLDAPAREALQRCLEQADLEVLAERSPISGPGADIYQYDIVLDRGGRRSQVVVAQTAVPDNLRPLIEWLEQRASGRSG
ncbi:MAG: hypothetical protein M3308_00715 [Actinomycetota bacterium]|nr:hypothetical protein [Actinomycetota bacterium]